MKKKIEVIKTRTPGKPRYLVNTYKHKNLRVDEVIILGESELTDKGDIQTTAPIQAFKGSELIGIK